MNSGNTPLDLQDAIISELKKLFADDVFKDPEGRKKKLSVFSQDLPIPESDDADSSLISVPYAIVRISQGEIAEVNANAETDIVIIICVYDDENNKQAYEDYAELQRLIFTFGKLQRQALRLPHRRSLFRFRQRIYVLPL